MREIKTYKLTPSFITKEDNRKIINIEYRDEKLTISMEDKKEEILLNEVEGYDEELLVSFTRIPNKLGYVVANHLGNNVYDIFVKIIRFPDIHRHSGYSFLDGMINISNMVKYTEVCGAITDHGAMFGTLDFYKKMLEENKKPIIGFEAYCETIDGKKDGNHLIILVKNQVGWENACKLISLAETNVYVKPHVSYDMLACYCEGLIVTSACLGGEIPSLILENKLDKAYEVAENLQAIFEDDFYIEIQRHDLGENEEKVNLEIVKIAKELGIKLIATTDSHFPTEEDLFVHECHLMNGTKKTLTEPHMKFEGKDFHINSPQEFEEKFADIPEVFEGLFEIVEKCNFDFILGELFLPEYQIPVEFNTTEDYFKHLVWSGFEKRFKGTPEEKDQIYLDRMEEELGLLKRMNYFNYFLIVWDYIDYAKRIGIAVGPGRGSVGGSLLAYCLEITELNPIKYGLLFSRFLNEERISMPDIDVDFEDERRDEVIEYVINKYGEKNVSKIITFGTLSARVVLRDVSRVLEYDYTFADKIAKMVPFVPGMTLDKALISNPELNKLYYEDLDVKRVFDIARKMEGLPRQKGQHACGVIIAKDEITKYVPEVLIEKKATIEEKEREKEETGNTNGFKSRTAGFNMVELEELGLLKMDFLGLRNMTVINNTLKAIKERHHLSFKTGDFPLTDPYVFKYISTGETGAIFQIESGGMKNLMKQMFQDIPNRITVLEKKYGCKGYFDPKGKYKNRKPENREAFMKEMTVLGEECVERLIAAISLYRPGPMDEIPNYVAGMMDSSKIKYDTPELEEILSKTYGVIVYQEQVQQIFQKLGGYSLSRGDLIRRAMGKKKKSIMAAEYTIFINGNEESFKNGLDNKYVPGCLKNGIKPEPAKVIWDKLVKFAAYAFNKSHSAGYAIISILTALLKYYFPEEYMTATLNSVIKENKKLEFYVSDIKNMTNPIKIIGPDVNNSIEAITIDDKNNGIRMGLKGIRNMGKKSEKLVSVRNEKGEFVNLEDFINKCIDIYDLKMIEALIYSGALDGFGKTRKSLIESVPSISEYISKMKSFKKDNLFELPELTKAYNDLFSVNIVEVPEFSKREKLELEYKYNYTYVTEHPIDEYATKMEFLNCIPIHELLPEAIEKNMEDDGTDESYIKESVYNGKFIRTAGIIRSLDEKLTKTNKKMYAFNLEDKTDKINAVIFKDEKDAFKQMSESNLVIIEGTIESDEIRTQLKVRYVYPIETEMKIPKNDFKIYPKNDKEFAEVKSLIDENPGKSNVIVVFKNTEYAYKKKKINPGIEFYTKLKSKGIKFERI